MKIRVFSNMCNGVYRIVINTEDWSCGDRELMAQYGEPEVDVSGDTSSSPSVEKGDDKPEVKSEGKAVAGALGTSGSEYVRILHGFPYARGFDTRDYGGLEYAVSAGNAWKEAVMGRIADAVYELRSYVAPSPLPSEEVTVV